MTKVTDVMTPGDHDSILASKIANFTRALELDLAGVRVLTEAATGAYRVTPVIAAAAGADVVAVTRNSRYGSVEEVRRQTFALADAVRPSGKITVVEKLDPAAIAAADVVTNSGHLRPLDAPFISKMKPGAVVSLMYEAWEYRETDVDLEECRRRSVLVGATNENHPKLRVFDYLGMLAVHGLLRLQIPVALSRIGLVSDNPFCPSILRTLQGCGADVRVVGDMLKTELPRTKWDAVVVADTPGPLPVLGRGAGCKVDAQVLGEIPVVVQVWGDVDRAALAGVRFWPEVAPRAGHMGILLNELGPDPILRLQAGGLKVGEILARASKMAQPTARDWTRLDPSGFVQPVLI
jgi:hypothetical protein